jgi:hypothetical protein
LIIGAYWVVVGEAPSWFLIAAALIFAALAYIYGERFWNWVVENPMVVLRRPARPLIRRELSQFRPRRGGGGAKFTFGT